MAGTKDGGLKGAAKILARDPDHFKRIGALGGKKGKTGGFAAGEAGRERARAAGSVGGRISRRGSKRVDFTAEERKKAVVQSKADSEYLALPGTHAADLEKDEEINEIAEQVTKDVMSFQQPRRTTFLDRFKKARV